jgi:hypothetical protein
MPTSKEMTLSIKGVDLASKPLQDIGAAVDKLVSAVNAIVPASEKGEKNLSELTSTASSLNKVLTGLAANKLTTETFTTLSTAVAAANEKLKELQGVADAAKVALSNTAAPTRTMTTASEKAASAAERQQKALARLTTQLETLRGKGSAVGIDFDNLAASQAKIDAAFAQAAPAYAKVNAAIEQYAMRQREAKVASEAAASADKAAAESKQKQASATSEATAMEQRFTQAMREQGTAAHGAAAEHGNLLNSFALFRDEGRTTLSLYQRLRGEILSMTAQFVGFYGAIESVKSGFESIEHLEGSKSILEQTFGDGAGQQLEYVKGQADRLGLSYIELTRNYAKFTAAATGSGIEQSAQRQIFETFAEAARVKNLTGEQTTTIFQALDKIMAKDAVGATELYRKLSTDLPEAASIFRKSIETLDGTPLTDDQFSRLLKSSKLTADFVLPFAEKLRASFADQLPRANDSATAALGRFNNAWDQLKVQVLEGGALDEFKKALQDITAFFKSDDGKKFTEQLATGARLVAQGLDLVVTNMDSLKKALEVLAALWALNVGKSFVKDLAGLYEGFQKVNMGVEALTKGATGVMGTLGKLAGVAAAFWAGYNFGTWLYDNVSGVRVFGALIIGSFDLMFTKIGQLASLMWAKIFHPDDVESLRTSQAKVFAAAQANYKEQMLSAGGPQGPSAPAGPGAPGTPGAPTTTMMTPKQKADAALADQKAFDDELFKAAEGLQKKLTEMRGALLRKDATDLKSYLVGLSESFKPMYDEIAKLKEEFPHANQTVIAQMTAQLNSLKAATLKDAGNKFNEEKAKKDLQDVNNLIKERDLLIQNQKSKLGEGEQSKQLTTSNIAGITATSNPAILAQIQKTQAFITTLPKDVQEKLSQVVVQLNEALLKLQAKPTTNVLADIKTQEEEINQALALRNTKISAIKAEQAAGMITVSQEREQIKGINDEYAKVIQQAKALIVFIETSTTLTDDQRKALEAVLAKMKIIVATARDLPKELYPAATVAEDIASGMTKVGAAFAKGIAAGKGLGHAFTSAWQAFKSFASDFLLKIGEMILKQTILNALGYGSGGGANGAGGGIAGLISKGLTSFMGGGAAAGAGAAGAGAAAGETAMSADEAAIAFMHSGGLVGSGGGRTGMFPSSTFRSAMRYHSGGTVGLQPDEMPIIAQKGERIMSRAQVAAMGQSQGPQHIQVINGIDHEDIVRQGLGAPSNTKVILNMIRANKASVNQALR